MTISSVTAAPRAAAATDTTGTDNTADTTDTPVVIGKKTLGQQDFLKLLAKQFQMQDPMKPMEDTAFIAQMAQFTALDQSSSMLQQMTQLRNAQDMATANSYIGRYVTFKQSGNTTAGGTVTGVQMLKGQPMLVVGDKPYPLSSVVSVLPGDPAKQTPSNGTN